MPVATNDADRKTPEFVQQMSTALVNVLDRFGTRTAASNETMAHVALWSALVIAQRDIGGPGACEWLRDKADELEAGLLRDLATASTH